MKMIRRAQLPDSHRLYHKFAEKRRDVQHGAYFRGMRKKTSSQIKCPHRNRAWHSDSVSRSCGNPNGQMRRGHPEALTRRDLHEPPCRVD